MRMNGMNEIIYDPTTGTNYDSVSGVYSQAGTVIYDPAAIANTTFVDNQTPPNAGFNFTDIFGAIKGALSTVSQYELQRQATAAEVAIAQAKAMPQRPVAPAPGGIITRMNTMGGGAMLPAVMFGALGVAAYLMLKK